VPVSPPSVTAEIDYAGEPGSNPTRPPFASRNLVGPLNVLVEDPINDIANRCRIRMESPRLRVPCRLSTWYRRRLTRETGRGTLLALMANELEERVEKLEKKLDEFIRATEREVKKLENNLGASIDLVTSIGRTNQRLTERLEKIEKELGIKDK
jgi:hypothetical protein